MHGAAAQGQPPAMALPLLTTKLYPPPARLNLVARQRLVVQVQDGLAGKLLLIAAESSRNEQRIIADASHYNLTTDRADVVVDAVRDVLGMISQRQ